MEKALQVVEHAVNESLRIKSLFFKHNRDRIAQSAKEISGRLRNGHKVLFFGNGGSAADAQHLAAELVGRFRQNRSALPAISLSTDTSILTAVGNDYGYENVFSRQIEALGQAGDTAIAISTSGNSPNVIAALDVAQARGMLTVGFTGETGGKMKDRVEILFPVPSRETSRIQETHILLGHILCELIEHELFPEGYLAD